MTRNFFGKILLLLALVFTAVIFIAVGCHSGTKPDDKINTGNEPKPVNPSIFTIHFSTDEGAPAIDSITVEKGKSMGDKYPENPGKSGYYFAGWHDGKKIYTSATPVKNDLILKAKWTEAASVKNKFHVYLAFGQSNMVGYVGPPVGLFKTNNTDWVSQYGYDNPPENFVVMAAANNNRNAYNRQLGNWYPALPPLNSYNNGLSPADFFGRTIADTVAGDGVKIGVIVVAVDGCKSNLFYKDKDAFISYITEQPDWMRSQCAAYVDLLTSGIIPNTGNYTTVGLSVQTPCGYGEDCPGNRRYKRHNYVPWLRRRRQGRQ